MTILLGSPHLAAYDDFEIGSVGSINGRTTLGAASEPWVTTTVESNGLGQVRAISGSTTSRCTLNNRLSVYGSRTPSSRIGFKMKVTLTPNVSTQAAGAIVFSSTQSYARGGVRVTATGRYEAYFNYRRDSFNSGTTTFDLGGVGASPRTFDVLMWFFNTTYYLYVDNALVVTSTDSNISGIVSTFNHGFFIDDDNISKVTTIDDFQYLLLTTSILENLEDFSETSGTLASPDLGFNFYTPNPSTNVSTQAYVGSSGMLTVDQGPGAVSGDVDPAYYYRDSGNLDVWLEADFYQGSTTFFTPVMARVGGAVSSNSFVGIWRGTASGINLGYFDGTTLTSFASTSVTFPVTVRLEIKDNVIRGYYKTISSTAQFTGIGTSYTTGYTIPQATLDAVPSLSTSTQVGFGYTRNNGFADVMDNFTYGYLQDIITPTVSTSATNSNLGYTNLGPGRNSEPNWHEDFGNLPGQKIENSLFQKRSGTGTAYDTAGVGLGGSGGLELRQLFVATLSNNGNAVPSSTSFEQSTWVVSGVTKPGKSTVVKQIDGYYDGSLLTFNSTATSYIRTSSNISITSNTTYVFSVYLATETGTASVRLGIGTSSNLSTGTLTDDLIITTTPQRFSFVYTPTASTSLYVGIVNNSAGTAGTIVAWNAQFELGDTPTAVMTTSGSGFTPRPALWTKEVSSSAQYIECDLVNVSGSITLSRPMPMALRCVDSANFIGIVLSSSDLRTVNLYVPGQLDQTIGVLPSYPCRLRAEIKLNALQLYYGPSGVRNPSTPFGDTIMLGEDLYQDLMVGTETGFGFIPVTSNTTTMTGLFDNYESGSLEEIDIERWNENFDGHTLTPNPSWSNVVFKLTNTTVNQGSQGGSVVAGGTLPTSNPTELTFVNGNIIRYADTATYRVTVPYSIYFEFYSNNLPGNTQWIFTIGEGNGIGYPEATVVYSTSQQLSFSTNSNNTAGGASSVVLTTPYATPLNQWNSVGLMWYNNGANRFRAYVNGKQVADQTIALPYNSTNGIAIGGDYARATTRQFFGGIRNVYIGQSLFWSV